LPPPPMHPLLIRHSPHFAGPGPRRRASPARRSRSNSWCGRRAGLRPLLIPLRWPLASQREPQGRHPSCGSWRRQPLPALVLRRAQPQGSPCSCAARTQSRRRQLRRTSLPGGRPCSPRESTTRRWSPPWRNYARRRVPPANSARKHNA
jgi:hypothetical protein